MVTPFHEGVYEHSDRHPWLFLKRRGCSDKELERLRKLGQGKPRAISPPFAWEDNKIQFEVKWFQYTDKEVDLMPYPKMLQLYGKHIAFLEWLSVVISTSEDRIVSGLMAPLTLIWVRSPLFRPPTPFPAAEGRLYHQGRAAHRNPSAVPLSP